MDRNQLATMKKEWQQELELLKNRCSIIETLLLNLDAYEQPNIFPNLPSNEPCNLIRSIAKASPPEGQTVMQRTSIALESISEPFTLVQLKELINKDGLGEIGRGNWGVIVQKLKKKKMIVCCEGEQGKPGALYRRAVLGLVETSPTEEVS